MTTIFERFAEAVIDTTEKNAEVQKWAFDAWENPPDDELAFREMYLKVLDYELPEEADPFKTMSLCLVAADMAAGKRHAVVPLQMMDLYLGVMSQDDFNAVLEAMTALLRSCAEAEILGSHEVQVQQEVIYWLTYSSILERIPFDTLDVLKGIKLEEPHLSDEDIEQLKLYRELYAIPVDIFMTEAVAVPDYFYDSAADADDEDDWDEEGWEDEDDWAEFNSPTLMDAIREDEQFDH